MKRLRSTLIKASVLFCGAWTLLAQESTMCVHQDTPGGGPGCTILADPQCASTDNADTCFMGTATEPDPCGLTYVTLVCPGYPDEVFTAVECCDAG